MTRREGPRAGTVRDVPIAGVRNLDVRWLGQGWRVGVPLAEVAITGARVRARPALVIAAVDYGAPGKAPLPDLACPPMMALGALAEIRTLRVDDDLEISGNAGDAESEALVRAQLDRGNEWAWCQVQVHARLGELVGRSTWLSGCSYADEQDFMVGGYFDDLRLEALEALHQEILTALPRARVELALASRPTGDNP